MHWSVRLGPLEWAKHTYERPAEDPLQLLGSARHGMQNGALGKLGDAFVLVVGDHVTELSKTDNKELAAIVAKSKTFAPATDYRPPPARPSTAPAPVIIIKKRRVPVMAPAHS